MCLARDLERFGGYSRQRELDHAAAVPSDDSLRLLAAGQHPGSEGCSGIAGCVHRASCFGQWPHGLGHLAVSSGGPPVGDLSESPDSQHQQSQELRSPCRPEVDHMCIGLPEGVGGDRSEKGRIDSATKRHFPGFIRGAKAEAEIKEVGRKRKRASRARGARDLECGEDRRLCFNGERLRTDEGLESSPLEASLDFCTWAICLPRWISRCKTSFSWHLTKSFTASRHSSSLSSTAFPLPLPLDGCFQCSGPSLSKKRLLAVAKRRLLHILVYSLNVLYLGRFPTAEEVGRRPTVWHLKCYQRLRALIAVCGDDAGRFPVPPGRSGPELVAHLFQLEKFLDRSEEKFDSYQRPSPCEFQPDPSLLLAGDHPELFPYKNLDADRLKLVGEGKWPMADFIEGPLWLPFVEPRFLLHGLDISQCDLPNFAYEDKDENLKLVKIWDRKGLLRLYRSPLAPSHFCRVFNAYKNTDCDRQIGDRRIPNARERAIDGPSAFLPPGFSLTNMRTRPFAERLVTSITDRRDFYHQAQVTDERAVSNMLPFAFSEDQLDGCVALDVAKAAEKKASRKKKDRELVGDGFGDALHLSASSENWFPAFGSLFQGDHLGVEFALESHETLLKRGGLLIDEHRLRGCHPFPLTGKVEGLIIDDYFAIGRESRSEQPPNTFAAQALARARQLYDAGGLLGSTEKDVVAASVFKAAGAEVVSSDCAIDLGLTTVGAPCAKRLALSTLSLRAARMNVTTAKLLSRLAGSWTSVIMFRRCFSAVVQDMFKLTSEAESQGSNCLVPLSPSVREELIMLAVFAPIIVTNVAVNYGQVVFASDASLAKGAFTSRRITEETAEVLWLGSDKKGCYSKLSSFPQTLLAACGEELEDDAFQGSETVALAPEKPRLLRFDFVEIYGGSGRVSKAATDFGLVTAPPLDLDASHHYDLAQPRLVEWVFYMIESGRFRSFLTEPPCTTFSAAAYPALRSYLLPFGFDPSEKRTKHGNLLACRSFLLLRPGRRHRRPCGKEQPRRSKMAWLKAWSQLKALCFKESVVASCQFGSPHRKEFLLLTYMLDAESLQVKCPGGHDHVKIQGSLTKQSAVYTFDLAKHFAWHFYRALRA